VIAVSVVVNEARGILIDAAKVTWFDDELIGYLNEFSEVTAQSKHDFYPQRRTLALVAGVEQQISQESAQPTVVALLDITRNVGGRAVTQADKALLDEANRFWPLDTQESQVENFSVNAKEPLAYYVTPPNDGTGEVRAVLGCIPLPVTGLNDPWPVNEQYRSAAVDFVLARAYAKNTKRQDMAKSQFYMGEYGRKMGFKAQTQIANTPKVNDPPEAR
jgi:hypothetical protein